MTDVLVRTQAAIAFVLLTITACALGEGALDNPNSRAPAGVPSEYMSSLAKLDCAHVGAADVRDVLMHVPAPRIVLLQGSVAIVTMEPFARFLAAMGYPESRLANPRDGSLSYDSFADPTKLAGARAFDYERTALAPMLIGHSQGGALAIRVLHELAGTFHDDIEVIDPSTGESLGRTTIVDPYTRQSRPVVGLRLSYVAALVTGWLPRVLLGQWKILPHLRTVPDSVDAFTGFDLAHDPIAGHWFGVSPYRASGSAQVRNVLLPAGYSHIDLPNVDALAQDTAKRTLIDSWSPDGPTTLPSEATGNIVHAADIWHSVKQHWCLQAQRLLTLKTP
jgi:hypothetical protein